MRQLTPTEKQQLDAKIEEQELQEKSPNRAEASKETSAVTGFTSSNLWKYSVLGVILCLIASNVFLFFILRNLGSNTYAVKMSLVVALMLLFNHIAFNFTKTGWKSRVIKIVAFVWIAFGLVYILWVVSSSSFFGVM